MSNKITIINNKQFAFLDTEIYWNKSDMYVTTYCGQKELKITTCD